MRFFRNSKSAKDQWTYGHLKTTEMEEHVKFRVTTATEAHCETEQFKEDKLKLNEC